MSANKTAFKSPKPKLYHLFIHHSKADGSLHAYVINTGIHRVVAISRDKFISLSTITRLLPRTHTISVNHVETLAYIRAKIEGGIPRHVQTDIPGLDFYDQIAAYKQL